MARDLYASARYDEALAMLNGVRQQESGNPDQSPVDRAVPLAVPARARTRRRSRSGDCRGRGLRSPVSADRDRGVTPRPHGLLRSAPAPAARHRAHTLCLGEGLVRQEGLFRRRAAVPRAAPPDRRSGHGRPAGRSAHAGVGLCRPQRGGGRASARAEARAAARRGAPPAPAPAMPDPQQRLHLGRRGRHRRQCRSGRKCRACRCRSPIRPASGASST